MRRYPHCDQNILHAPNECVVCDKHAPDLQAERIKNHVNFTGHHDEVAADGQPMTECPAEIARPFTKLNLWSGNTAKQEGWEKQIEDDLTQAFQKYEETHDKGAL